MKSPLMGIGRCVWTLVGSALAAAYEGERRVGKVGSALWCISLIYYVTDFQALILNTLEEESPALCRM